MTNLRHYVAAILAAVLFPSYAASQPLTVGTVALLVEDRAVGDDMLRAGLEDQRSEVRATAARVIGIGGRIALYPPVVAALQREQDTGAGAELIRAALFLRSAEAIEPATEAAKRLGGPSVLAVAEWLARMHPAGFATSPLLASGPDSLKRDIGKLAAMAAARSGPNRDRLTSVLSTGSSALSWRVYLDMVQWKGEGASALKAGLGASAPDVRQETLWWALGSVARGELTAAAAFDIVSASPSDNEDEWTGAARQLLARSVRPQPAMDLSALIEKRGAARHGDVLAIAKMAELTGTEREAIAKVLGMPVERLPLTSAPAPHVTALRLVDIPLPGLLGELISRTGCKRNSADAYGAARLTYQDDGRARQIGIDAARLPPECGRVVRVAALLTTALMDEPIIADAFQWLYVPMASDVVACVGFPTVEGEASRIGGKVEGEAARVGGKIEPPRKTKNVNPQYPASLQQAGIQGVVILEATITTQGCVRRARVLRSVHPGIDIAAMNAVTQWRFTPTIVDGTARPVIMTVTVNFTLK